MEFEDSRNALFVEPNAYILKDKKESKGIKKIVFSEPYESVPNYYINNDFEKRNCKCDKKDKPNFLQNNNCNAPNFDIKNILPLLAGFLRNGFDVNKVVSMLGNNTANNSNLQGILPNILSILSSDTGKNILNLLGNKNTKNNKKNTEKITKIKSTDFCIKDYEKVN